MLHRHVIFAPCIPFHFPFFRTNCIQKLVSFCVWRYWRTASAGRPTFNSTFIHSPVQTWADSVSATCSIVICHLIPSLLVLRTFFFIPLADVFSFRFQDPYIYEHIHMADSQYFLFLLSLQTETDSRCPRLAMVREEDEFR